MDQEHLQNTKIFESIDHTITSCLLSKLYSNIECSICSDIMIIPVSIECGHSFCYSCLLEWFKNKLTCPTCRFKIKNKPIINLKLKDICKNVIEFMIEHNPNDSKYLIDLKKESEAKYNLDVKFKRLFGSVFQNSTLTLIDNSDGVPRCGNCHWEAHGSVCLHCGTRFRFAIDSDDDDEDDDEEFEDVRSGLHHILHDQDHEEDNNNYDTEDSFINDGEEEIDNQHDGLSNDEGGSEYEDVQSRLQRSNTPRRGRQRLWIDSDDEENDIVLSGRDNDNEDNEEEFYNYDSDDVRDALDEFHASHLNEISDQDSFANFESENGHSNNDNDDDDDNNNDDDDDDDIPEEYYADPDDYYDSDDY
ncbi:unnamed protein product [Candida verbasci]|uniref:RING-type domain-containing protein n=1 Tax=Candida verbasci TaxID=1227364 RepID=A0A9W4TXF4_9ASCO|nr:unnamed protein product [Candida verbasci]